MLSQNQLPINFLPADVIQVLAPFLSPEDLGALARVSRRLKVMVRQNNIWKEKFEKHFPHRFAALNEPNTIWYVEFVKAYTEEYNVNATRNWLLSLANSETEQYLPLAVRRQFSLVKEGQAAELAKSSLSGLRYQDSRGMDMPMWATKLNYQSVADVFFKAEKLKYSKLDPKQRQYFDHRGLVLFHYAIYTHQSPEIIRSFITQNGANINHMHSGLTALTLAVMFGFADIVDELIKNGGDVNSEASTFRRFAIIAIINLPILIYAILLGHKNVVDVLLAHHVDQQRIITLESRIGGNLSLDPTQTIFSGDNALHVAIKLGKIDIVTAILDKSAAEIETRTANSLAESPLIIAVKAGLVDIVELLIKRGANINTRTGGATPLMWAVILGHENVVDVLLRHKADVSLGLVSGAIANGHYSVYRSYKHTFLRDRDTLLPPLIGETPLHWAAKEGQVTVVGKLLAADADLQARNIVGETAADVAKPGTILAKELKLLEYSQKLEQTSDDDRYPSRFGLFAREQKPAVKALLQVVAGNADKSSLDPHKGVLKKGELGEIYRGLIKR